MRMTVVSGYALVIAAIVGLITWDFKCAAGLLVGIVWIASVVMSRKSSNP